MHKKGIEVNKKKGKVVLEASPLTNLKKLQSLIGKINFLRRFIPNLLAKTKVSLIVENQERGGIHVDEKASAIF